MTGSIPFDPAGTSGALAKTCCNRFPHQELHRYGLYEQNITIDSTSPKEPTMFDAAAANRPSQTAGAPRATVSNKPADAPLIVTNRNGHGDVDQAIGHARNGQQNAPVQVILVVANQPSADPTADPSCGIAVVSPSYTGPSAWIPKNRLVGTGGARGELSSHLGRANALGAQVHVHVVPQRVVDDCNAGEKYLGLAHAPISSPQVVAALGSSTINAIKELMP